MHNLNSLLDSSKHRDKQDQEIISAIASFYIKIKYEVILRKKGGCS